MELAWRGFVLEYLVCVLAYAIASPKQTITKEKVPLHMDE